MRRIHPWVGLAVSWLLACATLYGQSVRERSSDEEQPPRSAPAAATSSPDLPRTVKLIVAFTNHFRAQHGRHELKGNDQLERAAQSFAEFMARTDKYGHTADGKEPWQRAAQQGYDYCILAENIAYEYRSDGFTTEELARKFITAWEQSPEHRKNLLDPDLYEFGVGVAHSKKTGRYYAVQDFGRPKSQAINFQIANESDTEVKYTLDGKDFTLPPRYIRTHERCRPATLTFHLPGDQKTPAAGGKNVFHPTNGDHFVIRSDESGHLVVAKQPSGARP